MFLTVFHVVTSVGLACAATSCGGLPRKVPQSPTEPDALGLNRPRAICGPTVAFRCALCWIQLADAVVVRSRVYGGDAGADAGVARNRCG